MVNSVEDHPIRVQQKLRVLSVVLAGGGRLLLRHR